MKGFLYGLAAGLAAGAVAQAVATKNQEKLLEMVNKLAIYDKWLERI